MKKYLMAAFFCCTLLSKLQIVMAQRPIAKELTERENLDIIRRSKLKLVQVSDYISQRVMASDKKKPLAGITATDDDRDGLSNDEEITLGTDPHNADTDGDGLLDGWEVVGNINGVNLRALGASPLHKDIFVQMDYMERTTAANGLGPNNNVIKGIELVFREAPVANPDNVPGIQIHLIPGEKIPYIEDLSSTWTEFNAIKQQHFDTHRTPFFHYMIWANGYDHGTSSGLSYDIPFSDFIVTLGRWNDGNGGTDDQKIGTFVHELGHNLGFDHGGTDDINYKPNYLSVMNYLFQMSGLIKGKERYYMYQSLDMPDLDENALSEVNGFGTNLLTAMDTSELLNNTGGFTPVCAFGSVDWNQNNVIETPNIAIDLNSDAVRNVLKGCTNEYSRIYFKGGGIGSLRNVQGISDRLASRVRKKPIAELREEDFKKKIQNKVQ